MKILLSIIGAISLVGTSATSLVACNTPQEYTPEKLAELKKEKEIKTKDGILEWIEPQEKPFNNIDNKWYFIIYKDNSNNIKISKRINNNANINVALPWSPSWIKVYRWDGNGEPNLPEIDKMVVRKKLRFYKKYK